MSIKTVVAIAIAATLGTRIVVAAPADARDGCRQGVYRGTRGACVVNRAGGFFHGRGYWDGRRYWPHRDHFHGGWRYR